MKQKRLVIGWIWLWCGLMVGGCVTPLSTATPVGPSNSNLPSAEQAVGEPTGQAGGGSAPIEVELLGLVTWPVGAQVLETELGGLSAITYDAVRDVYYVLSDDRGARGLPRFYQLRLDLADGVLQPEDVTWEAVVPLRTGGGGFFSLNTIDGEGLAYADDRLWVASEGNNVGLPPAIFELTRQGEFVISYTIPEKYLPARDGHRGVRNNRAFEGVTLTPDRQALVVGLETALVQDGDVPDLVVGSRVRWFWLDAATGQLLREAVYLTDPLPFPPLLPDGQRANGLSELIALETPEHFLALERAYAVGRGNSIRLYRVVTTNASDVQHIDSLPDPLGEIQPVAKELVIDLAALGFAPDNVEGMSLGPRLDDGRQVLLLVSDNNFQRGQTTQLIALALDGLDELGSAVPPEAVSGEGANNE